MTTVDELAAAVATMQDELNTFYLLWAAALVFFMQAGFAMLAAGSIRAKNVRNILLKNVMDACLGCLIWYLIGFGFAYDYDACFGQEAGTDCATYKGADSHHGNAFIGGGGSNFALSALEKTDNQANTSGYNWAYFFFQYAFAAAAATIVSGAVAERCQLVAYLIYTSVITGFIYPVVVHWVWDTHGFLCAWNPHPMLTGVIDFAGSGVVHMTGGFASLVAAKVLGPRVGWTDDPSSFQGHSAALQVLGTFILWLGWYGFNPGSTLLVHGVSTDAARSAVTTTISAASAAVAGLFLKAKLPAKLGGVGYFDLGHTCNSLLAGLVSITAGCQSVSPWAALLIGFLGAFVYHGASCLVRKLRIDDPLDAFAVHGASGAWGVVAVGFFANCDYSYAPGADNELYPIKLRDGREGADCGVFVGGTGLLLGTQITAVLIMAAWVLTTSFILFKSLMAFGIFRTPLDIELIGADVSKHGGRAYPEDTPFNPVGRSTTSA